MELPNNQGHINEGPSYFQNGGQPMNHFQGTPIPLPANQHFPGFYMNGGPTHLPSQQFPQQLMPYQPAAYQQESTKKNGPNPFENPLQPIQKRPPLQQAFANPYPSQQFMKQPPSGFQSILNQFKTQDGSIDVNKMMNTAGQMMNTFSQMSSIVKGFGGKLLKV
ncbi:spore coat protein [Bacillus sp. V5-8f]|nr:spore coat protein [Bacillus sp. V5-8f]